MIQPGVNYALHELFNAQIAELEKPKLPALTEGEQEQQGPDADNLNMMITPEELWKEIKPQLESKGHHLLVVEGDQGSGKTTIATALAHLAHEDGYKPLYSSAFEIMKHPVTLAHQAEGHDKLTLILDDSSYIHAASSSREGSKSKNFQAMIRHALKAKVFVIIICHFTTAVPPIFKNSNTWIFSAPTHQESGYMPVLVGKKPQLRQRLEQMVTAVMDLQTEIKHGPNVEFEMYGHDYSINWDVDGRICLIIKNGEASMYHSRAISCSACNWIGNDIKMDMKNYITPDPQQNGQGRKALPAPADDDLQG